MGLSETLIGQNMNAHPDCLGIYIGLDEIYMAQTSRKDGSVVLESLVRVPINGLDKNSLKPLDLNETFFTADKRLLAAAEKLGQQNPQAVRVGLICTGDQFISGEKAVAGILKHFPQALACDMESAAVAQTCYRYNVPFLSMRLISDVAGKETTNMAQYEDFWGTMAYTGFERTWALLTALTKEFAYE